MFSKISMCLDFYTVLVFLNTWLVALLLGFMSLLLVCMQFLIANQFICTQHSRCWVGTFFSACWAVCLSKYLTRSSLAPGLSKPVLQLLTTVFHQLLFIYWMPKLSTPLRLRSLCSPWCAPIQYALQGFCIITVYNFSLLPFLVSILNIIIFVLFSFNLMDTDYSVY